MDLKEAKDWLDEPICGYHIEIYEWLISEVERLQKSDDALKEMEEWINDPKSFLRRKYIEAKLQEIKKNHGVE